MSRRAWIIFAVLQILGAGCYWTWARIYSELGPWVWAGSYVFLLPGNIVLGWPITKLLWGSSLSLVHLQVVQVASDVIANACVWLVIAALWRRHKKARARLNQPQ